MLHRVKIALRNQCGLERDEAILACVSGGPNSMAMLNLLTEAVTPDLAKRKMSFNVVVLVIDCTSLFPGTADAFSSWISHLQTTYTNTFHVVQIED
jgi:3'-phosphoadenosine 5'-phosphosulfate sulfotransferase (PAPS reductase)/FAD synthetase